MNNDYEKALTSLKNLARPAIAPTPTRLTSRRRNRNPHSKQLPAKRHKNMRSLDGATTELRSTIAGFNEDVLKRYERPVTVTNSDSFNVLAVKAKASFQEAKTIIDAEMVELNSFFVELKEVGKKLENAERENQHLQEEIDSSNVRREQDESILRQCLGEAEKKICKLEDELEHGMGESQHAKNSWIHQRNTLLGLSGILFVLFITVLLLFASSANDKLTGTKSQNNGISVDAGTISTNLPFNVSWSEEQSNYIARVTAETVPTESVMDEKLMAALANADTQFSLYLLNANLDNADNEAALNLFDRYFDPNDALGDPTILPNHWIQDANGGLALEEPVIILLLPSENGTLQIGDEAVNYCKSGHTVCYSSSRGLFIAELYSIK